MSGDLAARITALIEAGGPMSVADYMALALATYYADREPFGLAGDFVTAPDISQMFGELIGVWCLAAHGAMGHPTAVNLVELGPGRGTLMADLLRVTRVRPAFAAAATVHLVETSPRLRERQAHALSGLARPLWHDRIDTLPDGPLIVVANEFFDALPIRQFVRARDGWRERVIGLRADGSLAFGHGTATPAADLLPAAAETAPLGAVVEVNRPAEAIVAAFAERIRRFGGALLAIDYGHVQAGYGDTLQAVSRHAVAEVLADPGSVDLTAHVDFSALAAAARGARATVHGPVTQGDFLIAMGLLERAGHLGANATDDDRAALVAAVDRLAGPDQMGDLFKVLALSSGLDLPGFDAPRSRG